MKAGLSFYKCQDEYDCLKRSTVTKLADVVLVRDVELGKSFDEGNFEALLLVVSNVKNRAEAESFSGFSHPLAFRILETAPEKMEETELKLRVALGRLTKADIVKMATPRLELPKEKLARRDFLLTLPKKVLAYSTAPLLLKDRCLRRYGCRLCEVACNFEAFNLKAVNPIIVDKCLICGACASACPLGAIQLPTFSDAAFASMLQAFEDSTLQKKGLVLTCPIGVSKLGLDLEPGVIVEEVPCVGAVGLLHFSMASASTLSFFITYCPLPDCPKAGALQRMLADLAFVKGSLKSDSTTIEHIEGDKVNEISSIYQASKPKTVRTRFIGVRREDFLESVRASYAAMVPEQKGNRFVFNLNITGACTFCGVCSNKCPEKAIKKIEADGQLKMAFNQSICVNCGYCERICPEKAMQLRVATDISALIKHETVEVYYDELVKCRICGMNLGSKRSLDIIAAKLGRKGVKTEDYIYYCPSCKQKRLMNTFVSNIS